MTLSLARLYRGLYTGCGPVLPAKARKEVLP